MQYSWCEVHGTELECLKTSFTSLGRWGRLECVSRSGGTIAIAINKVNTVMRLSKFGGLSTTNHKWNKRPTEIKTWLEHQELRFHHLYESKILHYLSPVGYTSE